MAWAVPKEHEENGYLHVPDYREAFDRLVAQFQHRTEALIIDQVNNPGGSLHQIYAPLGMLTDRPLPYTGTRSPSLTKTPPSQPTLLRLQTNCRPASRLLCCPGGWVRQVEHRLAGVASV
jgi:hypothetical protein